MLEVIPRSRKVYYLRIPSATVRGQILLRKGVPLWTDLGLRGGRLVSGGSVRGLHRRVYYTGYLCWEHQGRDLGSRCTSPEAILSPAIVLRQNVFLSVARMSRSRCSTASLTGHDDNERDARDCDICTARDASRALLQIYQMS